MRGALYYVLNQSLNLVPLPRNLRPIILIRSRSYLTTKDSLNLREKGGSARFLNARILVLKLIYPIPPVEAIRIEG